MARDRHWELWDARHHGDEAVIEIHSIFDYQLFRADGQWHPLGNGIEVMAHPHMHVGTFYIRAADTVEPLPRGSGQGPDLASAGYIDQQQKPSESVSGQANHAQDDQLS